ncbi:MAG: hypothetical protein R3D05_07630 [Dongiaceae bacterium]
MKINRFGWTLAPMILAGAVAMAAPALATQDMKAAIVELQHGWAHAKYELPGSEQDAAFKALIARADEVVKQFPDRAEPLGWSAIILSTYAKVQGGFGALDSVERARDQLVAATKIDDKALDGGIYTSLGALYYKVPGWPIGFGSDKKAKDYLERGLALNPTGIDQNYFYGDFLLGQGEKAKAKIYLNKALNAPPRPGQEDADAGRKREIMSDLKLASD